MATDRLRSIVPMFGGATNYVETLDAVLECVETHNPTTDELVGWHRGTFRNVSSRESILRRVTYIQNVGFIKKDESRWVLGDAGRKYVATKDTSTLFRIMCDRNIGLRSLMYELAATPLTIAEISEQQLKTHPELGWSHGETDMALQRANWLRSMGLVTKNEQLYELTEQGHQFVTNAVEEWGGGDWNPLIADKISAGTYTTSVHARSLDPEFRATALTQYNQTCPVSGVDHPGLLDIAHVLSWSEFEAHRADLSNVVPLSKTHHAAFDLGLFTIDCEYCLRVDPEFSTESDILHTTLIDQEGCYIEAMEGRVNPEYLKKHNTSIAWV